MVKTMTLSTAAQACLLFVAAAQQSFAQHGNGPAGKVTEETLAKCKEFGISTAQCSESSVLLAKRLQCKGGSGTAMLALGSDQTIVFIGVLGAVFGGVPAAFSQGAGRGRLPDLFC